MVLGPIITGLLICFSNIRGTRASALVSSLCEMPNLKRLVAQRHRMPRQALGSQRSPSERVFLRRLYFLNPNRSKYICFGFYPDRGNRAFFELGGVRQAPMALPPSIIPELTLHLPKLCEHLVRSEHP